MSSNSTDQTPAEEIRAAAQKLRETAGGMVSGWYSADAIAHSLGEDDAPWMALMSPHLAEPLAKWLDKVAKSVSGVNPIEGCFCIYEDSYHRAIEVAHVINGTTDTDPFEDAR